MTNRSLTGSIGCAYRLHQRPIGVLLTVLAAVVRPQKHSGSIVSRHREQYKRVGLHYIVIFKTGHCSHVTCSRPKPQKLWNRRSRDELGLVVAVHLDAEVVTDNGASVKALDGELLCERVLRPGRDDEDTESALFTECADGACAWNG